MKIYNLYKLMSAPISYVYFSSLFMIRVLLMKCRDKGNWHKYSGSLESEQGNSSVWTLHWLCYVIGPFGSECWIPSLTRIMFTSSILNHHIHLMSVLAVVKSSAQKNIKLYSFTFTEVKVNFLNLLWYPHLYSLLIWKSISPHLAPVLSILCTCV